MSYHLNKILPPQIILREPNKSLTSNHKKKQQKKFENRHILFACYQEEITNIDLAGQKSRAHETLLDLFWLSLGNKVPINWYYGLFNSVDPDTDLFAYENVSAVCV